MRNQYSSKIQRRANLLVPVRPDKKTLYSPLFLTPFKSKSQELWRCAPYTLRCIIEGTGKHTIVYLTDRDSKEGKSVAPHVKSLKKILEDSPLDFVEMGIKGRGLSLASYCIRNFKFIEFPGILIFSPIGELEFAEGNFEYVFDIPDAHFRYLLNTLHNNLPSEITKDLPGPFFLPDIREKLYGFATPELRDIMDGTGKYSLVHLTSKKNCYWCQLAEPHITRLEQTLESTDIGFLEIDIEDPLEERRLLRNFFKGFKIEGVPAVVLFSPEGRRMISYTGYEGDPDNPNDEKHYHNLVNLLKENIPGFKR